MVVLCDGMVRSGSTWSFNVALQIVRSSCSGHKVYGLYSENPAVLLAAARPRRSSLVIKAHNLDPSAYDLCLTGAVKAIFTWRQPYDAIASAMAMFGHPAEHWLGALRSSLRIWSFHLATGSACIVSYESIVQEPIAAIHSVGAHLGLEITEERALQIAQVTSAKQLRGFTKQIDGLEPVRVVRKDGYVYDRETLLHQNHIRDGRIGYGAALLDAGQRAAVDAVLREESFASLVNGSGATGV